MDSEPLDRDTFGPLVDISEQSVVTLASRIIQQSSGGKIIATVCGSYNIVHIVELECDTKVVIRIPATGWGTGLTVETAQSMTSYADTVRLLREKTTIPVPEILAFDTSINNEVGAPYICMSFVPGNTVSSVWFKEDVAIPREQLRLNILKSVAGNMAQLSMFSFDRIGSVTGSEASRVVIGPCFDWKQSEDHKVAVTSSGPFDSTTAYLQEHRSAAYNQDSNAWGKAETKIMDVVDTCLAAIVTKPGFALTLPDFDSQNIIVDDDGTVTGFIDLDLMQTMPRYVGYARYPGWITRDWDPLMYGWPTMSDSEDSPETLQRYRKYYNEELGKALDRQGDWALTGKSHIYEAMWIASLRPMNRLEICRKLAEEALDNDVNGHHVLYDIGSGYYDEEEWEKLEAGLRRLVL